MGNSADETVLCPHCGAARRPVKPPAVVWECDSYWVDDRVVRNVACFYREIEEWKLKAMRAISRANELESRLEAEKALIREVIGEFWESVERVRELEPKGGE